jgi:hypothetical protein
LLSLCYIFIKEGRVFFNIWENNRGAKMNSEPIVIEIEALQEGGYKATSKDLSGWESMTGTVVEALKNASEAANRIRIHERVTEQLQISTHCRP